MFETCLQYLAQGIAKQLEKEQQRNRKRLWEMEDRATYWKLLEFRDPSA